MNGQTLKIAGYSTALFSTWFFIEELGLLFDAGDGLSSALLQKARKIKHVFISHADRDHLMGLFQLNQLNARVGLPVIYYPAHCGSFPAMAEFVKKFDPQSQGTRWEAIAAGEQIAINKVLRVESLRNNHVQAAPELHKSLSYKLVHTKQKLKAAFKEMSPTALQQVIAQKGRAFITDTINTTLLAYSGDTPVEDYEIWNNTQVLIHEATFLEDMGPSNKPRNKHSTLPEVLEMVANIKIDRLVLSHFSSRYAREEIIAAVRQLGKFYNIKIPIQIVFPGELQRDVLRSDPVFA